MLTRLRNELATIANPRKAVILQRFFKTGPGQYAEGDRFLGIPVPVLRKIVKHYGDLSLRDAEKLLGSPLHEERLAALLILAGQFQKTARQEAIFRLYLRNTRFINNWDLVDLSAAHIVGAFLRDKPRAVLYDLAKSGNLWERRIAIVATFHYIKEGQSAETLKIARLLLDDTHDLIHKAAGWMLREVGKRCSRDEEEKFLRRYYRTMPRTMLRYAIERFPEKLRRQYLEGTLCRRVGGDSRQSGGEGKGGATWV